MRAYYDLHLHSCLSPCGDMDMTPNNIVGMATLLELNLIALTDHNTCKNCPAVMELGKANGICVIPGMELTTSEEIHVVCLFPTLENAMSFDSYVSEHQMKIKNKEEIYGKQAVMNSQDEIIDTVENLLILATDISIANVFSLVKSFGGVAYPAHIDRDSYSALQTLGEFPFDSGFKSFEISDKCDKDTLLSEHKGLSELKCVCSSDAHYLENMRDKGPYIEIEELSAQSVINYLSQ